MDSQLTRHERQLAFLILCATAIAGLAMAVAGRDDPLGTHGAIVLLASIAMAVAIMSGYDAPEPAAERLKDYYDAPSQAGILLAMAWVVFGLTIGSWVAWLLVFPEMTFDAGWASWGRLRPVHTTSVIFGFDGNALRSRVSRCLAAFVFRWFWTISSRT